jgi:hypothetical protein
MLSYQIQTNPGTPNLAQAQVGGFSFAVSADGGIGAFAEGNRIYNCTVGGPYHDSYSTKDLIVRNNYYYNVIGGPRQAMGLGSLSKTGVSMTRNGALAIFTTAQPHGFSAGAVVTVSSALVGGSSANPYNGTFQIASVPTPSSLTYAMNSDPGADASGSPVCNGQAAVALVRSKILATFTTSLVHGLSFGQAVAIAAASPSEYNGRFSIASVPSPTSFTYAMLSPPASDASGSFTFGALWQEGRLVVENNIIELVVNPAPYGQGYASGILVDSEAFVAPYVFVQALIRGNLIRNVDNAFDVSGTAVGIRLISCQGAVIEDNIINLNSSLQSPPYNISHQACGSVKYFNNQTPFGLLIQGYDATRGQSVNELAMDTDLSVLLAT